MDGSLGHAGQAQMKAAAGWILLGVTVGAFGQTPPAGRVIPEDHRPPLFLRETWKDPGVQETPVKQEHLTNPNLELKLYGPGSVDVRIVHHQSPKDDPTYIWSGSAPANWALTLRDKNNYVDLSGPVAKIRWRTKEAGFHLLRPVVKLADGTMLVGDHVESYTADWLETEFSLADVRWRSLDPKEAVETRTEPGWKMNPDLSRVDEVGFTDLTRGSGGGPGGGSRVDWIEVYGHPVPRAAEPQRR
ncbi:MAG TPA: hypothetical protein VN841_06235 [Bryobacteraceae bacterium]|nr:hypothetical protein [Bryobacteraceae bacterium]